MIYKIQNKDIEIYSMQKHPGNKENLYEFTGSKSLAEIGLSERFWFKAPYCFYRHLPDTDNSHEGQAKNESQHLLSRFLVRSIELGDLIDQYRD